MIHIFLHAELFSDRVVYQGPFVYLALHKHVSLRDQSCSLQSFLDRGGGPILVENNAWQSK